MKVLPINVNIFSSEIKNKKSINNHYSSNIKPAFTGKDSFQRTNEFYDTRINQLHNDIQNIIVPFNEQHKEQFIQLGKIGYDSQEKLKLINRYENELMRKKFSAMDGEEFKKAAQKAMLYEKYAANIQNFERTAQFVEEHPAYATDKILREINNGRTNIDSADSYFKTLKPFYDKYNEVKQTMDEDLDNISSKNLPEFREKIVKLDEQNKTAVLLFMVSGYTDAADITNETEQLIKDYKDKKVSFETLKRLEKINYKIQRFEENQNDSTSVFETIDQFLSENKDYRATNLSEEDIHQTYEKLLSDADAVIKNFFDSIVEYNQTHPVKLDRRIIDRTYKAQAKLNKTLDELIQKEKEKFYSQSNDVKF